MGETMESLCSVYLEITGTDNVILVLYGYWLGKIFWLIKTSPFWKNDSYVPLGQPTGKQCS